MRSSDNKIIPTQFTQSFAYIKMSNKSHFELSRTFTHYLHVRLLRFPAIEPPRRLVADLTRIRAQLILYFSTETMTKERAPFVKVALKASRIKGFSNFFEANYI